MSKAITYTISKEVQKQSIDTMRIRKEVLDYLHKHNYVTIKDVVDNQNKIPKKHRGTIYAWLIFGIES